MAKRVIKSPADYQAAHAAMRKKFDKLSKAAINASATAVADVALDCLSRSVQRAPVEHGDLRGSGFVEINGAPIASGTEEGGISGGAYQPDGSPEVVAKIGFTAPYAMVQHEHVEYDHPEGGQAKYLDSVVNERSDRWRKHLKDSVKKAVKEV